MLAAYRILLGLSRGAALVGAALLIVGMLITVADVVLRRTVNIAILGTVDITQLFVMIVVFLSMPFTFMADGHVAVELFTDGLRPRAKAWLKGIAALLAASVMALLAWYGLGQAQRHVEYGDMSQTIGLPIVWYWLPLLAGCALSTLAVALLAFGHFGFAVSGRIFLPEPPRPSLPD